MKLRKLAAIIAILIWITSLYVNAEGEAAYDAYTYNWRWEAIPSPHGYLPQRQIFGTDFGAGNLKSPSDFFADRVNKLLYIADSGNNRIIVLDDNYQLRQIITGFTNEGQEDAFNNPSGIFADGAGRLYIADQNNARIVVLTEKGELVSIYGVPQSDLIPEGFDYKPSKIVVDSYKRMYIQAMGVYQGMVCLDPNGKFINFYGSNRVDMTGKLFLIQLWKKLMTREQAKGMQSLVPIEYSNVFIDSSNFIYATAAVSDTNSNQIVKLNPMGNNIFRVKFVPWYIGSIFSDVTVNEDGIISVLDTVKGKILQCDEDGRLMFALGGIGEQLGTFKKPVAIEELDGRLLVLDSDKNSITEFSLTSFGASIRKAITLYNAGMYKESIEPWQEVIKRNSNYLLAYTGLGKAYYQLEDYDLAMKYFKLADSRYNFSDAFKEYSLLLIRENFGWLVLGIAAVIVTVVLLRRRSIRRKKNGRKPETWMDGLKGKVLYPFYTMFHPVNAYDGIKWEKKGSLAVSVLIVLLFFLQTVITRQATGFIFNPNDIEKISVISIFLVTTAIFVIWFTANWAVSSLMDGEGNLSQIWIGSAYALMPYILTQLVTVIITNIASDELLPFIQIFTLIGILWTAFILFQAVYTIHQYSISQTFVNIGLTIVGMGIILFLGVLVYSLFQQIYIFVYTIFNEIMFRM